MRFMILFAMIALSAGFFMEKARAQEPVSCDQLAIGFDFAATEQFCLQDSGVEDGVTVRTDILAHAEAKATVTLIYEKARDGHLRAQSIQDLAIFLLGEEGVQYQGQPVILGDYQVVRFWQPSGNKPNLPCDGAIFLTDGSTAERLYGMVCADGSPTPAPLPDAALTTLFEAVKKPF